MLTVFALMAEPVGALLYLKDDSLTNKLPLPLLEEIAPPLVPAVLFSKVEPEIFNLPLANMAPPAPLQELSINLESTTAASPENLTAPAFPEASVALFDMNSLFAKELKVVLASAYKAPAFGAELLVNELFSKTMFLPLLLIYTAPAVPVLEHPSKVQFAMVMFSPWSWTLNAPPPPIPVQL